MALFYRGCRLGSWFDFGSCSRSAVDRPPGTTREIAALLRAWKAPLLQQDGGHCVRYCDWLRNHWVDALPVWLAPRGKLDGPCGFEWPAPDLSSVWLGVVGELLLGALPNPNEESAGNLVEALAPGANGIQAIGEAVLKIVDVCPILAARVAKIYLAELVSTAERQAFFNLMLAFPEVSNHTDRIEEIARIHGNRDGFWLQQTVPNLHAIEQTGPQTIPHAYRLLSKSKDYRFYALGRWLREIR